MRDWIVQTYSRLLRRLYRAGLAAELAVLASMIGVLWAVKIANVGSFFNNGDHAALAFGFILIASYVSGRISKRGKMPALTGYLLAGFLFGPEIIGRLWPSLHILTPEVLKDLSIFNSIALGLIAFSAGGEMRMDAIKASIKSISLVTLGQGIAAFALVIPAILLLGPRFEIFHGAQFSLLLGVSLVLAVVTLANSPSSTLAMIVEFRAKGPLTTITLGVTILKDVMVIILFSFTMVAAKLLIIPGTTMDMILVGQVVWKVLGSIFFGGLLGYLFGKYIDYVGRESPLILIALSFFAMELAYEIHLSGLLLCMTTGFFVENFTDKGDTLVQAIERYSLPVFVLFFTITGAGLQLGSLLAVWPLVVFLVVLRAVSIFAGTTAGSKLAGDPVPVRQNLWLGFVTQAGVTLGLAILIESAIPGVGAQIKTVIVACVALNQVIGPVAFRLGLIRSGEGSPE